MYTHSWIVHPFSVFSLLSSNTVSANSEHRIFVNTSAPPNASLGIDPSFPGFAFEQAAFYNYAFDSSGNPNAFSQNLIHSVLKRTGGTPLIRVGGTSGDRAHFNTTQSFATNFPATEHGVHFHAPYLSVGLEYFDAFQQFPGAKYEFQVPWDQWENGPHQRNTLQWAEAGLHAIGMERLYSLELGNEANYYKRFNEDGTLDQATYIERYRTLEDVMKQKFPDLSSRKVFQALDIASAEAESLSVSEAFKLGLSESADSIKQVAYHYYQGHGINSMEELQDWVSHSRTEQQMEVFKPSITFLRENYPDIGLVLDEVGDNVGAKATKGNIWNCFATALWRVDFQLYAMSIGVARMNFQQIFNPRASMWLPVHSDTGGVPQVTANYYAMPFAADFIGDTGNTRVVALDLDDDDDGMIVAYAAYDDGALSRIGILNMRLWTLEDGDRLSRVISIRGMPDGVKEATVHYLFAGEGALQKHGITWKGLQWTVVSNGIEERVVHDSKVLEIVDNELQVGVDAMSAIIMEL
ncbi:hypothetical protein LTR37_007926 [Vermiconidia calcicola]|uniref:Uncharacterized protein n=1 Tax=Vermiconidia calcicola TaxID=1690605 RepID=A0ACC3NCP5_9PEZI|nr:hypothetical protein LTR37_007926 [Vermiconidia calcicola]